MKPWQKRTLYGLIALVVLGLLAWPKLRPSDSAGAAAGPRGGGGALQATAYVAETRPMRDRIRATGSLRADESVDLSAETSGRVTRIFFQEGSRVRRGQLLVKINDAELRAQRARLLTRIELAETREERQRRLLEIGGASQDEYDGVLGELNVLRSEAALLDAQIAKTEVRAPFDGVIGLRYVSEGAYVAPQSQIASLQAIDPMKVEFAVPERYAGRVRSGDDVLFTVAGAEGTFRGEVYAVEPRVDVGTRTLQIRARVPNSDGRLLPGAFADLELIVAEIPDALPVPAIAVISELGGKRVWVIEDGQAAPRAVETGIRTESVVQITDGLAPGDTVLTSGLQTVRAGQPVRVQGVTRSLAPPVADTGAPTPASPVAL